MSDPPRLYLRAARHLSAVNMLLLVLAATISGRQDVPDPLLVPYGLPNIYYGSLDLGDFDLDGDLDLLLTGMTTRGPMTRVFRLEDSLFFIERGEDIERHYHKTFRPVDAVLDQVSRGTAKWGDYDGDGDLDILVAGLATIQQDVDETVRRIVTNLYENRNGVFIRDVTADLPQVFNGPIAWGDYDADGDEDVVISGARNQEQPFDPATFILENRNGRLIQTAIDLPGTMFGDAAWADVDGDGDLDLALLGQTSDLPMFEIRRNDGAGQFTPLELEFPGLVYGSLDWGDYDGDGDPDLLVTGGRIGPQILEGETYVLRNDGEGRFVDVSDSIVDVMLGDARWADFNMDGRLDLIVFGRRSALGELSGWIYLNEDNNEFLPAYRVGGMTFGALDVGDYNGDGDVDFIISGLTPDDRPRTGFFMNVLIPEVLPMDLFPR